MQKLIDYLIKLFILLTFVILFLSIFRKDLVIAFVEWIGAIIAILWNWNYLLVFLSWLAESLPIAWIVIPWQNILLLVWWFFAQKWVFEMIFIILSASIWWIIWNYFAYFLWKKYGKAFFKKYGLRIWIGETEVAYLEKWIEKWWPIWIILWKFHSTTRAFLPFIAWSMWMKSKKFIIYNVIGSIFYSTVIILVGVVFVKNYKTIIQYIEWFFLWLIILFWLYTYFFKREEFKKYLNAKNDEIEKKVNSKYK